MTRHADSAGVPWAGRTLAPNGFETDDGTADPALAGALRAYAAGDAGLAGVAAALGDVRVLVPVVAVHAQGGDGADMALVTLKSPDRRTALPVFTSVNALAAWDASARPVPVAARRAALSAVDEGCSLLVLDPAGPVTAVLPRPALWAVAQGTRWIPSPGDRDVTASVCSAATSVPGVVDARCEPGDRAELRVVLTLVPGLDREALDGITGQVSSVLGASELVAERVDSLELKVLSS